MTHGTVIVIGGAEDKVRDRLILGRFIALAGGRDAQIAVISFVVLYLHDERGWSDSEAAAVLAAIQVLAVASRIAVGAWSDRVRSRVGPLRLVGVAAAKAYAISRWMARRTVAGTSL